MNIRKLLTLTCTEKYEIKIERIRNVRKYRMDKNDPKLRGLMWRVVVIYGELNN